MNIALAACLCLIGADAANAPVSFVAQAEAGRVEVRAMLPDGVAARLPVGEVPPELAEPLLRVARLDSATGRTGEPLFAKYRRAGQTLILVPRFALSPDTAYRAELTLPGAPPQTANYRAPARAVETAARVERVYPSADVLPANLLKFYIHFSRPMREGREIFTRIRLIDDLDREAVDPWRETELWSEDGRRLTLWIHPGRVKIGVNLREDLGPVLSEGRSYRLIITRELRAADGTPLSEEFVKRFSVAAADHEQVRPDSWALSPPRGDTREPLVVEFGKPLDRRLAARLIQVMSAGELVPGRIELTDEERRWSFTPERPWTFAVHSLKIAPELEDLGGNTPARPFEVDVNAAPLPRPNLELPFAPRSSSP